MTSQINPNNIDGNYPIAGVSNNTQGMRDNFTNIKTNFQYAETEIDDLQLKSVFKAALTGTTLDNNLGNNLVYNALVKGISGTVVAIANTSGTITIDCSAGSYQSINMAGNISLNFTSNTWPVAGTLGMVRTQITVDQVGRTLTLPNTVSNGIVGIQGYASNVITFANTGTFEFGFSTTNAGNAITIVDLNRPLSYYSNPVTIAANTVSTSPGTGALVVAGGLGIQGNLYVNGDIFGNVTVTDINTGTVTATGNIVGGNILTTGIVSATGNITGGNIIGNFVGTAISVSGNVTGGNINTAGVVSSTGNVIGGNVVTVGQVSAAGVSAVGNVIGGNVTTVGLVTATGNVTGGNINTAGLVTATGNVTGGNINTAGVVTATGNVTGGNLVTSQVVSAAQVCATGNILGGNLNAAGLSLSSNVVSVLQSTANITTTANISGGNLLTAGFISATGNVTGGNVLTAGVVSATGNVTGGNVLTAGVVSATANVTGGNVLTAGVVSATGNVTGGNVLTAGVVSATGNITGGNLLITGTFGNVVLDGFGGTVSATGNVTGANLITAGAVSAVSGNVTGNVTGGNIRTVGQVSATANVTGGNVLSVGIISATGNITGNVYFGNASQLTLDGTNVVGYKNIPQNSQSADYTLVLADAGKHIFHPELDAARTFTIPQNSSVPFPIGTAITFINLSANAVSITSTDGLSLSPTGTSGTRTLAQFGSATCIKYASTNWLISGSGLT